MTLPPLHKETIILEQQTQTTPPPPPPAPAKPEPAPQPVRRRIQDTDFTEMFKENKLLFGIGALMVLVMLNSEGTEEIL